jgi:hypothetical protein
LKAAVQRLKKQKKNTRVDKEISNRSSGLLAMMKVEGKTAICKRCQSFGGRLMKA